MNRDPSVAAAELLSGKKRKSADVAVSRPRKQGHRPLPDGDVPPDEGPGLEGDEAPVSLKQDTPGRPKSASSRQQTQPDQKTQTGNSEQDARTAGKK
jgi:hypothetical protein